MNLLAPVTLRYPVRGYPVGTHCTIVELYGDGWATVDVVQSAHSTEDDDIRFFDVPLTALAPRAAVVPAA